MKYLDLSLIGLVTVIALYGLVAIESATRSYGWTGDASPFVGQQALALVIGLGVMIAALILDYNEMERLGTLLYVANAGLLLLVLSMGVETAGAQRWLSLGPLHLQPSELAKVFMIITLARQLSSYEEWPGAIGYVRAGLHIAVPMGLILLQPDLGTSLVLVAIMFGMLFMSGAPPLQVAGLAGGGLAAVIGAISLHLVRGTWLPLKDYQLMRLIVFTNPDIDLLGVGYHLRQSLIAVGSGRLWGKGLFAGAQNQLDFLPAQHTDFIFSAVAEELGFIGSGFLLFLFFLLILRTMQIALLARNKFGMLIAVGVATMFLFQVMVNVGMTMGIMPITGIPLPFMSYGGSALLANFLAIGLLLNIAMRRQKIMF